MTAKPRRGSAGSREAAAEAELERIEAAVADLRASPGAIANADEAAERSGIRPAAFERLCRRHYHLGAADLLTRARLDAAKDLLSGSAKPDAAIAVQTGFRDAESLAGEFAARNGMSPRRFRGLRGAERFRVDLPEDYPLPWLRRALSRDPHSLTESLEGDSYRFAVRSDEGPLVVEAKLSARRVDVSLSRGGEAERVHAMVVAMLGLDQDPAEWVALATRRGVGRLVAHCPSLRIHRLPDAFDALLWTIVGQQINVAFAFQLRRSLVELAGTPAGGGLWCPPGPADVAALDPDDFARCRFSRQKAAYLRSVAELTASGRLKPDALSRLSATRAERTLLAVHGLGKWSVNYLMMRALGFADCLPLGDTGVTSALWSLFGTRERPDADATLRLMAPFSPWRSFATAHLWHWQRPAPGESEGKRAGKGDAKNGK